MKTTQSAAFIPAGATSILLLLLLPPVTSRSARVATSTPLSRCSRTRRLSSRQHCAQRASSIVLHFADDFGGQAFHLLGVVEEQTELDEFGSRVRDLAQTCDAG